MKRAPRWAFCLLTFCAASCLDPNYTGIYWLDRSPADQRPSVVDLDRELDRVLPEFGFAKERPCTAGEGCDWLSNRGPIAPALQGLEGAGAWISVAVSPRSPSITVIDRDHGDETPFVHALKQRIEDLLKQRFGVSDPRFDRRWLILVPNS